MNVEKGKHNYISTTFALRLAEKKQLCRSKWLPFVY